MNYEVLNFDNGVMPFIFHTDVVKTPDNYSNWHEALEIIYVIDGEGIAHVDSEQIPILKGDIFVINSGSIHAFCSDTVIVYHCLIISENFCIQNGIDVKKVKFKGKIRNEKLAAIYESMVKELEKKSDWYELGVRMYVLHLLFELAVCYIDDGENIPLGSVQIINAVKDVLNYIQENFSKKITIDEIVEKSGFSRAYFSREFKRITGKSIVDYINTVRCARAEILIMTGKYNVGEAALMCGFSSNAYFSKIYKKIMKKIPSQLYTLK